MNIAIACWSFSGGGLETRLNSQIKYLQSRGHKVFCLFGDYNEMNKINPDYMITGVNYTNIVDWSFSKKGIMSGADLAATVDFLKGFFEENKIDVVDIHTDYTIFAPAIAAGLSGIPVTYTVHGPGGVRFFDPVYKSGYLLMYVTLLLGIDRVYCVAEYLQAQCSGFLDTGVLRNGVDDCILKNQHLPLNGKWTYISRLDEFKIQPVVKILDIIKKSKIKQLDIYGDGPASNFLESKIKEHGLSRVVRLKGWINDTSKLAGKYDCIMGVGRVVLESCAMGVPTLLLSDVYGVVDYINSENINYFKQTNFTSRQVLTENENLSIINSVCENPTKYKTSGVVTNDLINRNIWHIYEEDIKKTKKDQKKINAMNQIYLLLRRSNDWVDFWNDDNLYALLRDNYYKEVTFAIDAINLKQMELIKQQLIENSTHLQPQDYINKKEGVLGLLKTTTKKTIHKIRTNKQK